MASIFGHAAVGYTLTKLTGKNQLKWLLPLAVFSTILPDFDVIGFRLGIPYEHPLGHRGFTHSISFALIWAALVMFSFGRASKLVWFLIIFFATLSHGILDAMTSGGMGVGFFIPLDNQRFFFPIREIKVSPLGIRSFFSSWGLKVVLSEFIFVLLPCLTVLLTNRVVKRLQKTSKR
ncbi:metal-dependent hydrolase [Tamlana fucoidanivorans]|uniref:Metal-dependent hydrolase n=1 Tax=Allotamlana fucoidanivorans TaxID=2583814 RepID=A0A5C4SPI6_9FLAO|nr:metal-dependent hydrolase [Tamlana fucoidanivorans]TNJ46178.1 metal-dependent hydrolase [Tamlana fucoidanivorans]